MSRFQSRLLAAAALVLAAPASAQIVLFADIAGYKIARIESQNVCFAATELGSEAGHRMVYSYYQTKTGQRWHVAGYALENQLQGDRVAVRVSIGDTVTLERETEARDGDFMLPFEALPEIEAHEALIRTGDTMVIAIDGDSDALSLPLGDYRAALGAIAACLNAL